jgi:hypothetical protein
MSNEKTSFFAFLRIRHKKKFAGINPAMRLALPWFCDHRAPILAAISPPL